MNLIHTVKQPSSMCAGDWHVYIHKDTVYIMMPAGFGIKKEIKKTIHSPRHTALKMSEEITSLTEKKANEIWKSNGWTWWDYYSDFELYKSKSHKAPIV